MDQDLENALQWTVGLAVQARLDTKSLRSAGAKVGELIDAHVEAATTRADVLRDQLAQLQSEITSTRATIAADDEARIAALVDRANELDSALTTERAGVEQIVPSLQAEFAATQAAREADWQTQRTEFQQAETDALREWKASAERNADAELAKLAAIVADAETKREQIENLYGLITDRATSGAFAKEAEAQQTEANTWRRNALVLGTCSAVIAVGAVVFAALDRDGSTSAHIGAIVVAILLSGLTAYAAKQSGSHRDREVRARRLALELTAFGPFTDQMTDPDNARQEYAARLFRGADTTAPTGSDHQVTFAQTIGEGVLDVIRDAAPKKG